MITAAEVDQQLKDVGVSRSFWGRAELAELQHILMPGEKIQGCLNGHYENGLAVLCATDQRLLLIDKKLFHLSVEDLRYDMIAEVDYGAQLITGTIRICTPTKVLAFTTFKPKLLRVMASFIQQRVIEIRQQFAYQNQPQAAPVAPKELIPQAPFIDPTAEAYQGAKPEEPALEVQPMPLSGRNPYATTPLIMRHRIGRFGRIATSSPS